MPMRPRLLSLGDRVRYDGREHTIAALHGTSVRLVDDAQAASVVLLGHLLASEGFAVLSTGPARPPLPEEGVLEGPRTVVSFYRACGLIGRQIHPGSPSELPRTTPQF